MASAARLFSTVGKIGLGIAIAGGVANTALYNVDGGHRAIIFDRFYGVSQKVVGEGTHFFIPWVQRPIIFDIRSRPHSVPTVTGSKDLQNIKVAIRILYRPLAEKLPQIYTNLGMDYDQRVLDSIVNEVLKSVVAQYDASELITQREMVSQNVSDELTTRAAQFGILLDDIAITDLSFGEDFKRAVERKQVSQQDAEAARFLVEKEEQLKLAAIIRAEGDSIAASMLAKVFYEAGEGLVELRKIEASEDIAYQLSQSPNVIYLPQGQNTLVALPQ